MSEPLWIRGGKVVNADRKFQTDVLCCAVRQRQNHRGRVKCASGRSRLQNVERLRPILTLPSDFAAHNRVTNQYCSDRARSA